MYDNTHPAISPETEPTRPETLAAPTRTVISVVLAPGVETNADVIACTVEAIKALPYVAEVTTRKVRARSPRAQPDFTR